MKQTHKADRDTTIEGPQRPNLKSEDEGFRHRFSEAKVSLCMCENDASMSACRTCACIPHPLKLREAYGIAAETDEFGVTWPLPDTPLERVSWQYYTQRYEVPIAPQLRKAIEQLATRMQDKEMAARAQYHKAYDHLVSGARPSHSRTASRRTAAHRGTGAPSC